MLVTQLLWQLTEIPSCEFPSGADGVALAEDKYLTDLAWNTGVGLSNTSRVLCVGRESYGTDIKTEVVDKEFSAAAHSCANISSKGLSFEGAATLHASAIAEDHPSRHWEQIKAELSSFL